jgi:uncharacterized protein YkwD
MIKLRVSSRDGVRELELADERILIGRGDDCEIKIEERNISRHNTAIERFDGGYRVVDLESRNGTFLNASRIQSATLSKGDAIRIGEVFLYVEQVPEPKGAAAQLELKPVPVADKEEVRHKIDDLKKLRAAEIRRGSFGRFVSTAVTAVSALILVGGLAAGILVLWKMQAEKSSGAETARRPAGDPENPNAHFQAEALELLQQIERQAAAAEVPTPVHLARIVELQKRYAEYFASSGEGAEGRTVQDPFQRALQELTARRTLALEARFHEAQAEVDAALAEGRYADATEALRRYHEKTGGGHEEEARLLARINETAKREFEQMTEQIALMKKYKHYGDIAALCTRSADRFKGTPYRMNIAQELDLAIKRAEQELMLARQKGFDAPVRASEPVAKAPAPVPTPTPTPSPAQTPKPAAAAPTRPATPPPAPALSARGVIARFTDAVNAGKVRELIRDGKKIPVTGADDDGIRTETGVLAWSTLSMGQLALALIEASADRELIELGRFCRANGEEAAADKALFKYAKGDKSRQPEVDELVAGWRGLGSAPEGGYAWNARKERWEDRVERASSIAVEKAEDLIKGLARATNDSKIESTFAKIEKIYSEPDVNSAAREEIRNATIAALKEVKEKLVAEVQKKAKRPAGDLSTAARKLEEARKECLRVMYDLNIYYVEGHPRYAEGLKKYLESCEPLHNVWNGKWQSSVDGSLKSTIETVNKVNDILSKKLNSAAGNELTGGELEEFVANAAAQGQALNIRNYAMTNAQREMYNYNDRVDKYNNGTYKSTKLASTGAPGDTIEHLNILNAWRHELGRKKLFMDARLQRAAQKHAADQAAAGKIWHVGSNGSPSSRCQAEGFPGGVGENCCLGYGSAMAAFKAWDEASDHCRNQCSENWNCVGVGHVGRVWVQDFGRTTPPAEIGGN